MLPADARHRTASDFDKHIRLAHGYRVVGPHGRIGTVDGTQCGADHRVDKLLITRGVLRKELLEVAIDDVEWVLPYGRRIVLSSEPIFQVTTVTPAHEDAAVDGYDVVTVDGDKTGTVVGISEHSIIVRRRRGPFSSLRAVPSQLTVVKSDRHAVIALASATTIATSPRIEPGKVVDEAAVRRHYEDANR